MTSPRVLELDDVIRRHAWNTLKKRSNVIRRWLLQEKDFLCDVDWSALTLHHHVSKFDVRPDSRTYSTAWGSMQTGFQWIPLHTCDFENGSEGKQCHTFEGSRQTTTWIAVDLAQAFTISNSVDIDVTFPPHFFPFLQGHDPGFKVNKVKGIVSKEILEWQVNSLVEVMPSWKAHAQLLARQETHVIDLEVRTTVTVPSGVLPVCFRRKSDNSSGFRIELDKVEEALRPVTEGGVLREDEAALTHSLTEAAALTHITAEAMTSNPTVIVNPGPSSPHSDPRHHQHRHQPVYGIHPAPQRLASRIRPQLVTRGTCYVVSWTDQKVLLTTRPLSPPAGCDRYSNGVHQSQDGSCLEASV